MDSKLSKLKIMFWNRKSILKEKINPSPFHIDFLINNTRLNRVVFVLKVFAFIFKVITVGFLITSVVWGFYFILTSYFF
jgi:hypothetical protein